MPSPESCRFKSVKPPIRSTHPALLHPAWPLVAADRASQALGIRDEVASMRAAPRGSPPDERAKTLAGPAPSGSETSAPDISEIRARPGGPAARPAVSGLAVPGRYAAIAGRRNSDLSERSTDRAARQISRVFSAPR